MIRPLRRLATGEGGSSPPAEPSPLGIPADWLPLPTLAPTDEKLVGLVAVYENDFNAVTLACAYNFTVDWGDGSALENFSTGDANHEYDFADLPESSWCEQGYRQAIITVTPQEGQHLAAFMFGNYPERISERGRPSLWLDLAISAPQCFMLQFGSGSTKHTRVARVDFSKVALIGNSAASLFYSCHSLVSVALPSMAGVTNFDQMFCDCTSLRSVPFFDTSAGTSFEGFLAGCPLLEEIPAFDLSSAGALDAFIAGGTMLLSRLRSVKAFGATVNWDLVDIDLSAAALNEIFTNLGTASEGAGIFVGDNPGSEDCDASIATAKGWIVHTIS